MTRILKRRERGRVPVLAEEGPREDPGGDNGEPSREASENNLLTP